MLVLNNDDLKSVLDMKTAMAEVERAYLELFRGEATCMPRCNVELPTRDPGKKYALGITSGGSSVSGYVTIRMQSDITYEHEYLGVRTREKYAVRPGQWCGLYMLFDAQSGEPLAIMNEGYLQHLRQGADGGIGAKYMAREDAEVLGMLGSGGMAYTHAPAICQARNIKKMKVFSPTRKHREKYAKDMAELLGIEVEPVDEARKAHEGVDIIATCTDSSAPVIFGRWLEEGTHIVYAAGPLDQDGADRVDVSLRLGNTPMPRGKDWHERSDTVVWAAPAPGRTEAAGGLGAATRGSARGVIRPEREILLKDLLEGKVKGRTGARQITFSDRGGMRGVEHNAVAAKAYELAKARGLGHQIPTEWFLQDIRD
jgi:ornithine cyclodeaminase/alanine dehydrogenase-like protein (mu-crystallin family)